jgi:hypothetical protein
MRLLLFCLLLSLNCFGQSILDRPVPAISHTGTVGSLLRELNQLPGITLSFSSEVLDLDKPCTLTGRENSLRELLKTILQGQPVKLIEQEGKVFIVAEQAVRKKITISGFVTDSKSGERLIGASVFIPGKGIGTTSNAYGFYSLTIYKDPAELRISYTGYSPQVVSLQPQEDLELPVALEPVPR